MKPISNGARNLVNALNGVEVEAPPPTRVNDCAYKGEILRQILVTGRSREQVIKDMEPEWGPEYPVGEAPEEEPSEKKSGGLKITGAELAFRQEVRLQERRLIAQELRNDKDFRASVLRDVQGGEDQEDNEDE